jgi:hypothetical protein
LKIIESFLRAPAPETLSAWLPVMNSIQISFEELKKHKECPSEIVIWVDTGLSQLTETRCNLFILAPWLDDEFKVISESLSNNQGLRMKWDQIQNSIDAKTSYSALTQNYQLALSQLVEMIVTLDSSSSVAILLLKLKERIKIGMTHLMSLLKQAQTAAQFMHQKLGEMNFNFLLEKNNF